MRERDTRLREPPRCEFSVDSASLSFSRAMEGVRQRMYRDRLWARCKIIVCIVSVCVCATACLVAITSLKVQQTLSLF